VNRAGEHEYLEGMANQLEKAQRFRELHERLGAFVIPNPWDIGTARILAGLGFKALATTSAGSAFSQGRQDGALGRDAVLAHARAIVSATDLPVSADLENCFGHDPCVVAETIKLAAETGLVGGSVEDFSGNPRDPIYDFAHAVERVQAAAEAAHAQPFPFTLTARAENYLHGRPDLDDTIRRLQAFQKVGADVLYAPGLADIATVRTVCSSVSKPVNVLAFKSNFSVEELAAVGARRISLGSALTRVAMGAFLSAAREISKSGTFNFLEKAVPSAEISGFMEK
jgi:2-methylisocitrate lyase-like PEP mutase family enzyme